MDDTKMPNPSNLQRFTIGETVYVNKEKGTIARPFDGEEYDWWIQFNVGHPIPYRESELRHNLPT